MNANKEVERRFVSSSVFSLKCWQRKESLSTM